MTSVIKNRFPDEKNGPPNRKTTSQGYTRLLRFFGYPNRDLTKKSFLAKRQEPRAKSQEPGAKRFLHSARCTTSHVYEDLRFYLPT